MLRSTVFVLVALVTATISGSAPAAAQSPADRAVDPSLLAGLEARSIGPATMSGRVAAVTPAPSDPRVIYVGAATGGLWKSTDAGLSWKPVFDDQAVAAVGAVAVSPDSPDVVWVGTGEGNPRNSASVGNGVYRSRDGGKTWEHLGLPHSERIHRILLHPRDPNTAWVAALGKSWGEHPERGVFKTTDGGGTWRKVLGANDTTGAADLVMDPGNPDKLVAALWDHRRHPWSFRSGGPGSGIFVSLDGGETWVRRTEDDGLPAGDLGRIGLAVAPSDPNRVYALVESSEPYAVYRSDDGGRSFRRLEPDPRVGNRPFYYADLRVDSADPNRLYSLWSRISVSEDGGKSFRVLVGFEAVHPDHHALWIDPADPNHLWNGNDGGIYESRDRGETWRYVTNLPLAQFYHLAVDDDLPYNVYGGLQDNGSWKGPSEVWENGGIRNHHWQEVAFGDGFDTVPLPGDPSRGFAMSQEGYLVRWDRATGERRDVRPPPVVGSDGRPEEDLRFNWNAAVALDPFEPETVYYGSQFVHRSRDLGETWEIVSPDLTTDDPEHQKQAESGGLTLDVTGAENFTSIVALAPSPLERGVLWAGTDDGRLWLTRDGGGTWTNFDGRAPRVPAGTWIPHVAPSPHDAGTAFVVFDNHRRSDWTPYVVRVSDYGETWKRIDADPDLWGYALVIAQDPVDPDLLFLGTEFGLFVSPDGGDDWLPWKHGVPTASVMDLVVHPREHDLVLGTHGRAAYVLDDVSPLRGLSREVMAEPLHFFPPRPARQHRISQTGGSRFPGHTEFRGENPPYGALLTFSLAGEDLPHPDDDVRREEAEAEREAQRDPAGQTAADLLREEGAESAARASAAAEEAEVEPYEEVAEDDEGDEKRPGKGDKGDDGPQVEIEIRDAGGKRLRSFRRPVHRGVNRVAWDLRLDAFEEPPRPGALPRWSEPQGPEVVPGTYTVTLRYGDHEASHEVEVLPDPRYDLTAAEHRARLDAVLEAGALQEAMAAGVKRIVSARRDVVVVLERARAAAEEAEESEGADGDASHAELIRAGEQLLEQLEATERTLWTPPDTRGIPAETDAASKISYALRSLEGSYEPPTAGQRAYLAVAEAATRDALAEVDHLFDEEVTVFREMLAESGLTLLPETEPVGLRAVP